MLGVLSQHFQVWNSDPESVQKLVCLGNHRNVLTVGAVAANATSCETVLGDIFQNISQLEETKLDTGDENKIYGS